MDTQIDFYILNIWEYKGQYKREDAPNHPLYAQFIAVSNREYGTRCNVHPLSMPLDNLIARRDWVDYVLSTPWYCSQAKGDSKVRERQ